MYHVSKLTAALRNLQNRFASHPEDFQTVQALCGQIEITSNAKVLTFEHIEAVEFCLSTICSISKKMYIQDLRRVNELCGHVINVFIIELDADKLFSRLICEDILEANSFIVATTQKDN